MDPLDTSSPSPKQWRKKPRTTTISATLSETLPLPEAARLEGERREQSHAVQISASDRSYAGKISEMNSQPTKTPVSLLQELLVKRGITPKYELVQTEGQVHDPIFSYRVTVEKLAAIGSGRSKKEAKHVAAKAILDQIIRLDQPDGLAGSGGTNNLQDVTSQIVSPYENTIPGNPIGTLQEMCMSRRWPPPSYVMEGAEGLPHERRFTIACTIYNHREVGTGKSKKLAKREAAFKMWEKLRGSPEDTSNIHMPYNDEDGDEISHLVSYVESRFAGLKDSKINTLKMPHSLKVSQFHQTIKSSTGAKLRELQTRSLNSKDFNYVQFLQEIASEQEIEVTYVDVEERSVTGKVQCLVQLSTLPVAVCYGCGATSKDAQAAAAHSTLEYLKILTKV